MKNELITGCNITTRAKNILISNGIFTRKDLIDELNGRMCKTHLVLVALVKRSKARLRNTSEA